MYSTPSRCLRALLAFVAIAALLGATISSAPAQDKVAEPAPARSQPPADLVIKNGFIERQGPRVPATLRNVVDVLIERFPRANVTIVGADDVRIGDITLRWGRRIFNANQEMERPLQAVLYALKAASQQRFSLEGFGENDFVLAAQNGGASPRMVEVFQLGPLINGRPLDPGLQRQLEEAEAGMAVLSKQFTEKHPRMTELQDRVDILKRQLSRAARSPQESETMLAQIQGVIRSTLEQLRPGEPPPDFKYHAGTGLLVVIGTDDAIEVTRKVIAALR